jgi:hypothetical protein
MRGHVVHTGQTRNTLKIFIGKLEQKRPSRNPMCVWEDNIRNDLIEIGWQGLYWTHLAQDRDQWRAVVNTVMNLRVP